MQLDLVDVFGSGPLRGNPLAVVHDAGGMSEPAMLALTRWLGFSETTFLVPATDPAADYRVRIFYPGGELDFAGHPTLGTCYAWLQAGGVARTAGTVVQQCGLGLVAVRQEDGGTLAFAAPPMRRAHALSAGERRAAALLAGVDEAAIVEARWADNGPPWQVLVLASAADVREARPQPIAPPGACVALAGPGGEAAQGAQAADWELRAFFADQHGTLKEDPVTGSLNAGVATLMLGRAGAPASLRAAQGQCVGADGRITWRRDDAGQVWIGGRCDMVAAGASLPG
jgi:PhzF family phenazine biosynthesis protein